MLRSLPSAIDDALDILYELNAVFSQFLGSASMTLFFFLFLYSLPSLVLYFLAFLLFSFLPFLFRFFRFLVFSFLSLSFLCFFFFQLTCVCRAYA